MLVHRSLTNLALLMVKITFLIVAFIIEDQLEEFQNGRNSKMTNGLNSNMANGKNSNMANWRDSNKIEEIKLSSFDLDVPVRTHLNHIKAEESLEPPLS